MKLHVAAIEKHSEVHGPGVRYVIWVQGCSMHCYNCIAPEWQKINGGTEIDVDWLVKDITENAVSLTISGGEPMLQAEELLALCGALDVDIDIILFTGYTEDQIRNVNNTYQRLLWNVVDLVIDGPYIEALNDNVGLRGSCNQKLHFITDKLKVFQHKLEYGERKTKVYVGERTFVSGIPTRENSDVWTHSAK